jgi:hypothetical protein
MLECNLNDPCLEIDKDVVRTDREVPFFKAAQVEQLEDIYKSRPLSTLQRVLITLTWDGKQDYVQGMNELTSPFVYTIQDEALVYFCVQNLLQQIVSPTFVEHLCSFILTDAFP